MILLVLSLCGCAGKPLRLHIMANSDSVSDQSVKLLVRNAVMQYISDNSSEFSDMDDAKAFVNGNISQLESIANDVLKENGESYSAHCVTGEFDFPDRTYADVLYPAGIYPALRIVLGEGSGKNWWCVIYPPLCIADISELPDEPIVYRSAVIDLFTSIFGGSDGI